MILIPQCRSRLPVHGGREEHPYRTPSRPAMQANRPRLASAKPARAGYAHAERPETQNLMRKIWDKSAMVQLGQAPQASGPRPPCAARPPAWPTTSAASLRRMRHDTRWRAQPASPAPPTP